MTPYLKCCARSQTLGQTCLPEMDQDHCCFSAVRFTYHMENEHSLQFQSYNSYAEQMWQRSSFAFFDTRKPVYGDFRSINTHLFTSLTHNKCTPLMGQQWR